MKYRMKNTLRAWSIALGLALMLTTLCCGQLGFVADTFVPVARRGPAAAAQTPGQFVAPTRITSEIDNAAQVTITR